MSNMKTVQVGNKESKIEFQVAQPYAEGHVLSAVEAKQLNQTRAENVCNNMRGKVKATIEGAKDAFTEEELHAEFKAYDKAYVFTEASAGSSRSTMTPVEKEAKKIARQVVVAQLKESGRKVSDIEKDAFDSQVAKFAESDQIQKIAKARVKQNDSLAEALAEETAE